MVTLPIKKKWFDMISSGEKKEEYREINQYYLSRFVHAVDANGEFLVALRNGYSCQSPTLTVRVSIDVGYGVEKWGAMPDKQYFVLKILEIIS